MLYIAEFSARIIIRIGSGRSSQTLAFFSRSLFPLLVSDHGGRRTTRSVYNARKAKTAATVVEIIHMVMPSISAYEGA